MRHEPICAAIRAASLGSRGAFVIILPTATLFATWSALFLFEWQQRVHPGLSVRHLRSAWDHWDQCGKLLSNSLP